MFCEHVKVVIARNSGHADVRTLSMQSKFHVGDVV